MNAESVPGPLNQRSDFGRLLFRLSATWANPDGLLVRPVAS